MAERKFTRSLYKPGSAAQVRESVSQAVRESTIIVSFSFVFECFEKYFSFLIEYYNLIFIIRH